MFHFFRSIESPSKFSSNVLLHSPSTGGRLPTQSGRSLAIGNSPTIEVTCSLPAALERIDTPLVVLLANLVPVSGRGSDHSFFNSSLSTSDPLPDTGTK